MPIEPEQVESNLRTWIRMAVPELTAEQVRLANQEHPRPPKVYVTLMIVFDQRMGRDYKHTTDELITPTSTRYKEITDSSREGLLSVQAFGKGASRIIRDIELSKRDQEIKDFLWNACLTVSHPVGGIRNLAGVLDSQWEPRARQDFVFRYGYQRERGVDVIETFDLNGNVSEA